ncbi:hypothetical protein NEMIN01_2234 [Nematocida minor]|uniref:uncharacterized protein n=1 Tax=Nematocida minor TaxID=1912983 RepID=UPI002220ADB3|nr:uncharacterized protein NEMIN01_2234 [Nematocida minor]KAI5192818.1 hypothetical protein NEMIN01_2234 [Nematocida minor]
MENRRPIRIQKKEEILRIKETAPSAEAPPREAIPGNIYSSHPSSKTPEHSVESDSAEENTLTEDSDDQTPYKTTNTSEDEDGEESKLYKTKKDRVADQKCHKKRAASNVQRYFSLYASLLVSVAVGYFLYRINYTCHKNIQILEDNSKLLSEKVSELEAFLHSKHKEIDVADYLEGARIIHDLTTESFSKAHWIRPVKGLSAEVAIDRVCTKHHCYSFGGEEGKLAIAFKNEKIIRKIGILHPLYDNRQSAIKKFTVDCIVNNEHVRVGEFEYEIPGDSFQQFVIPATKCTGIIFRIKSNHGNKEYTCIYKVYAFE